MSDYGAGEGSGVQSVGKQGNVVPVLSGHEETLVHGFKSVLPLTDCATSGTSITFSGLQVSYLEDSILWLTR